MVITTRQFLDAMHKSAEGGMSRDARPLLADTCARFADAAEVDKVCPASSLCTIAIHAMALTMAMRCLLC